MRKRTMTAAALVAVAVLAAGCGGGGSSGPATPSGSESATPRPSSDARLTIIEPKNGAVLHGTTVHVVIGLKGARIVQATSTHVTPDRGHIHLLLDDKVVSMTYGLRQTIRAKPGPHVLQVEFVGSDHLPFDPRVIQAVTFEVKP